MKQINNKTILKQGDKTYQPVEMKKNDRIFWCGEIWKVNNEHQLLRESDGCQYNSGLSINDKRSRVFKSAYLLVKINYG
jgi:hypothetical protein